MTTPRRVVRRQPTRVFISFDYDGDRGVAALLGGQLRKSIRFRVANWSMKEAAPQRLWKREARQRINRSDVVLVVVGRKTYCAGGVKAEVAMARNAKPPVPIRQVIGYKVLIAPCPVPGCRWTLSVAA